MSDLFQNHMSTSHTIRAQHKKFRTNIEGGCQSGRKVVTHNSKSDLTLVMINKKKQASEHSHKIVKILGKSTNYCGTYK